MSGIIGPITPARIAFALGTVGVGALVGGLVADHRDADVGTGAVIGGASALAGLALLYGGQAAWRHFTTNRAATTGAANLGTSFGSTLGTTATRAATPLPALSQPFATRVQLNAARLLDDAAMATTNVMRPVALPIPAYAATPALPVVSRSGSTFLNALTQFVR